MLLAMGEVVLHAIRCLCRRADDDVLFGATGDLARRKLFPRLFHVFDTGVLPQRWRLIGIGEHGLSTDGFIEFRGGYVSRPPAFGDAG